jgi:oligoribonuclease NrnB/cAMP/cGMP phosphodiesterase (DHH superfamily)
MRNVTIVYHKVDFDGLGSALIAKDVMKDSDCVVELIGWNYGDQIPNLDRDVVVLVDISFPKEIMRSLDPNRTIWIDHHISALKDAEEGGYNNLPGIRRVGIGAIALTWELFHSEGELPEVISLLAKHDVWLKDGEWESRTVPFQRGLRTSLGMSLEKLEKIWPQLLRGEKIEELIDLGRTIDKYDQDRFSVALKRFSFEAKIGDLTAICMMSNDWGGHLFRSVESQYPVLACINVDAQKSRQGGKNIYQMSLYGTDRCDADLSIIAKAHGGGGHARACGFPLEEGEFIHLMTRRELI